MARNGPGALAAAAAVVFAAGLVLLWPRLRIGLFVSPQAAPAATFKDDLQPILANHCYGCHNPQKRKGKLDLQQYADEASVLKARKVWKKVLDQVHAREMPPEKEPR